MKRSERTNGGRRDARCGCGRCCRVFAQDDRERRRGTECPDPAWSTVKVLCVAAAVHIASASERCRGSLRWCGDSPVAASSVYPCRTTPTEWEIGWLLSWTTPAFGSLHPPQYVAQQLRGRGELPLCVSDMCVAYIRADRGQMTLDIDPAAMPLEERIDGQPVA